MQFHILYVEIQERKKISPHKYKQNDDLNLKILIVSTQNFGMFTNKDETDKNSR